MDVNIPATKPPSAVPPSADVSEATAPEVVATSFAELRSQVLTSITLQTRPAPLPRAWDVLTKVTGLRQLCSDPESVAAVLRAQFTDDELLCVGVLVRVADHKFKLSSVFGDSKSSFTVLHDNQSTPIDAMSVRGLLSRSIPASRLRASKQSCHSSKDASPLLLAATDGEARVFQRLGFAYVSGDGLERISGKRVRELFAARPSAAHLRKYNLTLPGWQIEACINKPSTTILNTIKHLCAIRNHYKLDPGIVFRVWLPSGSEFTQIRRALKFADAKRLAEIFRKILAQSSFAPNDAQTMIHDRTEISFSDALKNLRHTIDDSTIVPRAADAAVNLEKLKAAFHKAVIRPLRTFGADSSPWDIMISIMAANFGEDWFRSLEIVRAAESVIAGKHPGDGEFDERLFNIRVRISVCLMKHFRVQRASA